MDEKLKKIDDDEIAATKSLVAHRHLIGSSMRQDFIVISGSYLRILLLLHLPLHSLDKASHPLMERKARINDAIVRCPLSALPHRLSHARD